MLARPPGFASRRILAGTAGLLLALTPGGTEADSWRIPTPGNVGGQAVSQRAGNVYVEVEPGVKFNKLQRWTYGSVLGASAPVFDYKPTETGAFVNIMAGFTFGGRGPLFGADRMREVFANQYASRGDIAQAPAAAPAAPEGCDCALTVGVSGGETSSTTHSPETFAPNSVKTIIGPQGPGAAAAGTLFDPFVTPWKATLKTDPAFIEPSIGWESRYRISSRLSIANRIAAFGGWQRYTYDLSITDPIAGGTALYENTVSERVRVFFGGVSYALGARYAVTDNFSVAGGALVGIYLSRIKFDGSQCTDNEAGVPGCQPFLTSSISQSVTRFGLRLGAQLGADYDLGFMSLGLHGRFGWQSAAPKIDNPVVPGQHARITTASSYHAAIFARAVFRFGM